MSLERNMALMIDLLMRTDVRIQIILICKELLSDIDSFDRIREKVFLCILLKERQTEK